MKRDFIVYTGIVVALLNTFDAFATNFGLLNHYIEESNPIMSALWIFSPMLFLSMKLLLSICILIISILVSRYSRTFFKQMYSYSLIGLAILYSGIFFMHIYWFSFV